MVDQNPWVVENIEAFSFYCCPECDFKSKQEVSFKRHALECHNKAKSFFIMSNVQKSNKNAKNECMEVEMESEFQYKFEDGIDNFIECKARVKEESMSESDEEELVRLDEHEAQKLINGPDYITDKDLETFDENETEINTNEENSFDRVNFESITEAEISDDETFDGIDEELETYDDHDVEKSHSINGEIFNNESEVDEEKFFITDEKMNTILGRNNITNEMAIHNEDNIIKDDLNGEEINEIISESKMEIESNLYVINTPKCPICEKEFTGGNWRWNIKIHMKSIHKFKGHIIISVEKDFGSTTKEQFDIVKTQTVQILPLPLNQDKENSITISSPRVLHNSITIGSEGHRHFCFYCGRQITVIFRHLIHWHKEEKEMIQISQMSNKTERDRAKEALKRHGDHLNNLKTLKEGKGILIVARTQKNNQDPTVYIPCPNCLVWVSKHNLSMHRKKCHCSIDNFQGDIHELRNRSKALMNPGINPTSLSAKIPRVGFTKYSTCIIATYFDKYVTNKTMPKIEAVQAFLNDQPDESELKEYSVNQIKQKVRNMGKRKSNKINDCRS